LTYSMKNNTHLDENRENRHSSQIQPNGRRILININMIA
jgi:hypothetical protein